MEGIIKAKTLIKKGTKNNPILVDIQVIKGRFRIYNIDQVKPDYIVYPVLLGEDITMEYIKEHMHDEKTKELIEDCEIHSMVINM